MRANFKLLKTLIIICGFTFVSVSNAQDIKVIDNKGTLNTIRAGYQTIYHTTTGSLAITDELHKNTNIHIESSGNLTIDAADINDETHFYITNTSTGNRTLSFTGFAGAYLRVGGTEEDIKANGLSLNPNSIYLVHINEDSNDTYFNATKVGMGKINSIIDEDENTQIQVEEAENEDKIRFDTNGVERMIISNTGNIGIGTETPDASALLELSSTTQGVLPPRMTNAQMNAIANPTDGLIVYCTDCSLVGLYMYETANTVWKEMNTWLGYKTISHDATTTLAITDIDHNNVDIHIESTGELSINADDVTDATTFYITNTTDVDRTLSFTGFEGAFLRNGGTSEDIKGTGLSLKSNSRYLANISEKVNLFYFNTTSTTDLESRITDNENALDNFRATVPISDNYVFRGYTAHQGTGLPEDQGWAGGQLNNDDYFRVLQDGEYDIGGISVTDQPYLNLRDRGNQNAQMIQELEVDDIDTALSTDGGFAFSFFGRMNPTADDNDTLALLLEWETTIGFAANTSRIWMNLSKNTTNQLLETQGQTNAVNIGGLDEYINILLSVQTDGSAELYLNGVEQTNNINTVLSATAGRGDQFTIESGSRNGEGEEANIIQYGGYFATTDTTPHKITLSNASKLDVQNASIDYLPNAVDRELEFDLDNAPAGATILINPRHLSGVVKLTRINNAITFNGYSEFTKVSSTPFFITHLGDNKWVL